MDHPCFEDEEYLKRLMERSNDTNVVEIPSDIKTADDFYNWIHSRKSTTTEPKEKK